MKKMSFFLKIVVFTVTVSCLFSIHALMIDDCEGIKPNFWGDTHRITLTESNAAVKHGSSSLKVAISSGTGYPSFSSVGKFRLNLKNIEEGYFDFYSEISVNDLSKINEAQSISVILGYFDNGNYCYFNWRIPKSLLLGNLWQHIKLKFTKNGPTLAGSTVDGNSMYGVTGAQAWIQKNKAMAWNKINVAKFYISVNDSDALTLYLDKISVNHEYFIRIDDCETWSLPLYYDKTRIVLTTSTEQIKSGAASLKVAISAGNGIPNFSSVGKFERDIRGLKSGYYSFYCYISATDLAKLDYLNIILGHYENSNYRYYNWRIPPSLLTGDKWQQVKLKISPDNPLLLGSTVDGKSMSGVTGASVLNQGNIPMQWNRINVIKFYIGVDESKSLNLYLDNISVLNPEADDEHVIIVNPYGSGDYTTIQAAVNAATTDDIILISDGNYKEKIIIRKDNITLMAANRGGAVLDGSNHDYNDVGICIGNIDDNTESYNNIVIDGIEVKNFYHQGLWLSAVNSVIRNCNINHNGNNILTDNLGYNGVFSTESSTNNSYLRNKIHHNGRADGYGAGTHDHGIYTYGNMGRIENNLIYSNQSSGIQIAGYKQNSACNFNIINNTICDNRNFSQIIFWSVLPENFSAGKATITNNIVSAPNEYPIRGGIYFYGGGNHILTNNLFYENGAIRAELLGSYIDNTKLSNGGYTFSQSSSESQEIDFSKVNTLKFVIHLNENANLNWYLDNVFVDNDLTVAIIDEFEQSNAASWSSNGVITWDNLIKIAGNFSMNININGSSTSYIYAESIAKFSYNLTEYEISTFNIHSYLTALDDIDDLGIEIYFGYYATGDYRYFVWRIPKHMLLAGSWQTLKLRIGPLTTVQEQAEQFTDIGTMIGQAPGFVDDVKELYYLNSTSPAIHAGNATLYTLDLDGQIRPVGMVNIGAYQ